jgi:hypothetical protein
MRSLLALTMLYAGCRADVELVNALEVPLDVQAGMVEVRVPAKGRVTGRLPKGTCDVRVVTASHRVVDEDRLQLTGQPLVYDLLGAAPLSRGQELEAGKKLLSGSGWQVAGDWRMSLALLITQNRNHEAAALAERLLRARPEDGETVGLSLMVVEQALGRGEAKAMLARLADANPDAVEVQRRHQNELLLDGRRDEALAKYRQRAAQRPQSALAGYLAARLERPEQAIAAFRALLQRFPDDVNLNRGLAGSLLQTRQFAEAAARFQALAKLRPLAEEELGGWAQALIGAGRADEALERVAAQPQLYAMVAKVAKKEPADKLIGEHGPLRGWYEALYGSHFDQLPAADKAGWTALAAARKSGKAFLEALKDPAALAQVGRSLGLVAAAEAVRQNDAPRAKQLLDAVDPPASLAERAAILDGRDAPELHELSLENQAALELARGWRSGDRKLVEQARADDLFGTSVALALAWN